MSATYRFLFADLLTNKINGELPMQGVTFGRRMSKAGPFQGSFGLDYTGYSNNDILDMTEPGRTAIYIERSNTIRINNTELSFGPSLCWGGILWTRSWQEQGKSIQMTGQSFESFPYQCDLRTTLDYSGGIDQRNLLINLWETLQAMASRDIGVLLPSNFTPDNIIRTNQYFDYGAWSFGKIIDDQLGLLNAFDYTIEVAYDSSDQPYKFLRVDDMLSRPLAQSQIVFDYPGIVNTFWWPENAAKGATSESGIGAGQDATMLRSLVTASPLLAAGYPDLTQFYTNKDTQDQTTLDSQTLQELEKVALPITIPTIQLNPDQLPQFGDYLLGDQGKFTLKSPRFVREGGMKDTMQRIVGWDVTPASSQSTERIAVILDGQDQ